MQDPQGSAAPPGPLRTLPNGASEIGSPLCHHRRVTTEAIPFIAPATKDSFDEAAYLEANPDVARAVADGRFANGEAHFSTVGHREGRMLAFSGPILAAKARKLDRLRAAGLLDPAAAIEDHASGAIDFLPPEVAAEAGIVDTDAVSSNGYDPRITTIIDGHPDEWILDAGAGRRDIYFSNVVNYEIVPYPTTDVLGVLERTPFADGSFDYVVSNAVLEHVRDPFSASKEMIRVLKPGGLLLCAVPFLQPYHGYPHHYFNMTQNGLRSLFERDLEIVEHTVPHYFHPAWTTSWILNSWAAGLSEKTRKQFRKLRVADLMDFKHEQMPVPWVAELDEAKQFELASGTFLTARKPV